MKYKEPNRGMETLQKRKAGSERRNRKIENRRSYKEMEECDKWWRTVKN